MEDDQQFCLRWNNHQSTLIQNFDTLLESGTLVDCTLAAEGKYLKAHKVVLSACSPYFEGLLSEHYDKHPVFILKDVKFKELKAMMEYMYRGEVNISQEQLTALLKAAESLQIKGLSDNRTGGASSTSSTTTSKAENTRSTKQAATATASSAVAASASTTAADIPPHASSGLTIEKNSKVPRSSLSQVSVSDLPDGSVSPQLRGLSSREGSQSPTRRRKRTRRRSLGNEDTTTGSIDNHDASNSSDVNLTAPTLVAPVAEDKSHADQADPIGRSALMQQLTKPPTEEMMQMSHEKAEPTEEMIQPKSEYMDDQESVEDLTNLDDDMNDLELDGQESTRPGPSHDPSQHGGVQPWHMGGDRSNPGVAAAIPPGQQDEVFLAAHDAAQAQRDSQGLQLPIKVRNIVSISNPEFSSGRVMTQIHGNFVRKGRGRPRKHPTPMPLPRLSLLKIKKITAYPEDERQLKKYTFVKKKPGRPLKKKKGSAKVKTAVIKLTDFVKHKAQQTVTEIKTEAPSPVPTVSDTDNFGLDQNALENPVAILSRRPGRPPGTSSKVKNPAAFIKITQAKTAELTVDGDPKDNNMENQLSPPSYGDFSMEVSDIMNVSVNLDFTRNDTPGLQEKRESGHEEVRASTESDDTATQFASQNYTTNRPEIVVQRKRGRPPKPKPLITSDSIELPRVPRKRGRPPKPKNTEERTCPSDQDSIELSNLKIYIKKEPMGEENDSPSTYFTMTVNDSVSGTTNELDTSSNSETKIVPKKRGRPPKLTTSNTSLEMNGTLGQSAYEVVGHPVLAKKRGRPRKYLELASSFLDVPNIDSESEPKGSVSALATPENHSMSESVSQSPQQSSSAAAAQVLKKIMKKKKKPCHLSKVISTPTGFKIVKDVSDKKRGRPRLYPMITAKSLIKDKCDNENKAQPEVCNLQDEFPEGFEPYEPEEIVEQSEKKGEEVCGQLQSKIQEATKLPKVEKRGEMFEKKQSKDEEDIEQSQLKNGDSMVIDQTCVP